MGRGLSWGRDLHLKPSPPPSLSITKNSAHNDARAASSPPPSIGPMAVGGASLLARVFTINSGESKPKVRLFWSHRVVLGARALSYAALAAFVLVATCEAMVDPLMGGACAAALGPDPTSHSPLPHTPLSSPPPQAAVPDADDLIGLFKILLGVVVGTALGLSHLQGAAPLVGGLGVLSLVAFFHARTVLNIEQSEDGVTLATVASNNFMMGLAALLLAWAVAFNGSGPDGVAFLTSLPGPLLLALKGGAAAVAGDGAAAAAVEDEA
jgi:hypothetical protein